MMHSALKWLWVLLLILAASGCTAAVPTALDPGAVTVDGELATPVLLVGDARTVYAVVHVQARELLEREPGPVNLALCIDTSGSMAGAPIAAAKKAALGMIASMKNGDHLAIVTFNTRASVVLHSVELDDDVREEVALEIGDLEAVGTTDLAGGLHLAVREVENSFDAEGVNRVVLLGDGVPNHAAPVEPTARRAGAQGISISALGVGLDYDEVLMGKIAELSGGRYRYVDEADKIAGFLAEEVSRLNSVYARNVSVSLTAGPGVVIEAVVGAPNPPHNGRAEIALGDLARGESRDVVVRLTVTPRKADAPVELLDAMITFDDAVDDQGLLERRVYFGAKASADEGEVAAARNSKVELAAALAEAGATAITALELAKQKQFVRARKVLTDGAEAARAQSKRTPSPSLDKQAKEMLAVAADMPLVDPEPPKPATTFEFSDDALAAPEIAPTPLAPPAASRQKELHDRSYKHSH